VHDNSNVQLTFSKTVPHVIDQQQTLVTPDGSYNDTVIPDVMYSHQPCQASRFKIMFLGL